LYGTLPTENGLLTSLQTLNIEHNDVIGTMPTELCQLTNLEYLNLGRNALTGSIPTEIGHLSNLEKFMLNSNRGVSGSVPASIALLTSLRTVYLDGTGLTSGVDHICTLPNFRDGGGSDDDDGMVAYADCGNVDGIAAEVNCECCRCCADIANNGMGCSMDLI
jgi:Leucine rich repeat